MPPAGGKFHVVLVEGSVAQRLAIGDILTLCNLWCTAFEKPSQAIDFLEFHWRKRVGNHHLRRPVALADTRSHFSPNPSLTQFSPRQRQENPAPMPAIPLKRGYCAGRKSSLAVDGAPREDKTTSRSSGSGKADPGFRRRTAAINLSKHSARGAVGRRGLAGICAPAKSPQQLAAQSLYPQNERWQNAGSSNRRGKQQLQQSIWERQRTSGARQAGSGHLLRAPLDDVHLVLCDISFSTEKEVFQLLAYAQNDRKRPHIPLLLLASPQEPGARIARILAAGAAGCLRTPLTMKTAASLPSYAELPSKPGYGGDPTVIGEEQPTLLSAGSNCPSSQPDDLAQVYEQLGVIGRGATSTIYLVRRLSDSKLLALKEIFLDLFSPRERAMTINEIAIMRQLGASPMIGYADSWLEGDSLKIIMEYAGGGTVHDFIQNHKERKEPVPFSLIASSVLLMGRATEHDGVAEYGLSAEWTAMLAVGLEILHEHNIIHRDLKGQNVLLTRFNDIRLCDFGASKLLSTQTLMAKTAVGTPFFMSPEASSGTQYGTPSDLWALGVLLYELLHLRRPFDGMSMQALFQAIQTVEPAWHSYTSCNGFCLSDSDPLQTPENPRSPGYAGHSPVASPCEHSEFERSQRGSGRHHSWSTHGSVHRGGIISSGGSGTGTAGGCRLGGHSKGDQIDFMQHQSGQGRCSFLTSMHRQQLQEVVKRLLSKEPANRPTALDLCCHPLFILDVLRFLKSREAPDSRDFRQKIISHFRKQQYEWPHGQYLQRLCFSLDENAKQFQEGISPLQYSRSIGPGDDASSILGPAGLKLFAFSDELLTKEAHADGGSAEAAPSMSLLQQDGRGAISEAGEGGSPLHNCRSATESGRTRSTRTAAWCCIDAGQDGEQPAISASGPSLGIAIASDCAAASLGTIGYKWVRDDAETRSGDPSTPSVSAHRSPITPIHVISRQAPAPTVTVGDSSPVPPDNFLKVAARRRVLWQAALRRVPKLPAPGTTERGDVRSENGNEDSQATGVEQEQRHDSVSCSDGNALEDHPSAARADSTCNAKVGTVPLGLDTPLTALCRVPDGHCHLLNGSEKETDHLPASRLVTPRECNCSLSALTEQCTLAEDGQLHQWSIRCGGLKSEGGMPGSAGSGWASRSRYLLNGNSSLIETETPQRFLNAHANCPPMLQTLAHLLHRCVRSVPLMGSCRTLSTLGLRFVAALAASVAAATTAAAVSAAAMLVVMHGDLSSRHAASISGFLLAALIASALLWTATFEVGREKPEGSAASRGVHLACEALDWLQDFLHVSRERALCILQDLVDRQHFDVFSTGEAGHLLGVWSPVTWVQQVWCRLAELLWLRTTERLIADSQWIYLRAADRIAQMQYYDFMMMDHRCPSPGLISPQLNVPELAIWEHEESRAADHCQLLTKSQPPKRSLQNFHEAPAMQLSDDPLYVSLALLRAYCSMLRATSAGELRPLSCCTVCSCTAFKSPPELWNSDNVALRNSGAFSEFERRLLSLESLESSRLTAMPPYARLAFAMNMCQLLQRRAFILNQETALSGSPSALAESRGARQAAQVVFWSQKFCQMAPWACLAGLLGLLFAGQLLSRHLLTGAYWLVLFVALAIPTFLRCYWASKQPDKAAQGTDELAHCQASLWFVCRTVIYGQPLSAALLSKQLCTKSASEAFGWRTGEARALCFLLGGCCGFFPLLAFDSDVDTQLSAFVREYLTAHVQIQRGAIELPAFFLSYAPFFAASQPIFSLQEAQTPASAPPGSPGSGYWSVVPLSPAFPAKVPDSHLASPIKSPGMDTRVPVTGLERGDSDGHSSALPWQRRRQVHRHYSTQLGRSTGGRTNSETASVLHSRDSSCSTKNVYSFSHVASTPLVSKYGEGNQASPVGSERGHLMGGKRVIGPPSEAIDVMFPFVEAQNASSAGASPLVVPRAPCGPRGGIIKCSGPGILQSSTATEGILSEQKASPTISRLEREQPRDDCVRQAAQRPQQVEEPARSKWKPKDPFLAALLMRKQPIETSRGTLPAAAPSPAQEKESCRRLVRPMTSATAIEEQRKASRREAEMNKERACLPQQERRSSAVHRSTQEKVFGCVLQPSAETPHDPACVSVGIQEPDQNCPADPAAPPIPLQNRGHKGGRQHIGHNDEAGASASEVLGRVLTSAFSAQSSVWRLDAELLASLSPPCACPSMRTEKDDGVPFRPTSQESPPTQFCCTCVDAALQDAIVEYVQRAYAPGAAPGPRQRRVTAATDSDNILAGPKCPMGRSCRRGGAVAETPEILREISDGGSSAASPSSKSSIRERARHALERFRLLGWLMHHIEVEPAIASELARQSLHGRLEWRPFIVQPVSQDATPL